jgi:type I restriction enzyme S subunit
MMAKLETTKHGKGPGSLPAGWRWVRLGEVCKINPRKRDINRLDNQPTSFVQMEAVDAKLGVISGARMRPFSEVKKGYTYFDEGDVLFAKITPCMQNGKHAVASGMIDGFGFASTEFHVMRPTDEVLAEWIHYFVRQPFVLQEAINHFTGAVGQQRVPDNFLTNLGIPLPSIVEQRRIMDVLRERMAAVEKARGAAKERQAAAEALHVAYLREVFDASEPSEWTSKRLGDVLVPHKDLIHPGDRESGTAEFVGLEHLEPHTGRRFGSLTLDLSQLTGRKPTFRQGQIVYGYLRPYLNKVWIAEFDGCSSVDQFAFEVRSDVADVRFVAWFMRSSTFLRRSAIVTTTGQLPRIGTEEIAAVEIGLPPLSRQRVIADRIDRWTGDRQRLWELLQAEADAINRMPAALLREAFTGQV